MLDSIFADVKDRMEKSVTFLGEDFKTVRSGKAHPSMIENISVDNYGNKSPLKQMATISSPESKLIVIQPWDTNTVPEIEKALLASDIGVTPNCNGQIIRLSFPPLSEEQRHNLAKIVHKKGEEAKVSIRNIRRDGIHHIDKNEKDEHLSKDTAETGKKDIQKFTDEYIDKIDVMIKSKTEEIMEV